MPTESFSPTTTDLREYAWSHGVLVWTAYVAFRMCRCSASPLSWALAAAQA